MSRRLSAGRRAGIAVGVAAAALLGAEVVARSADVPDPSAPDVEGPATTTEAGAIMLQGSPWLLWELRPGVHEELGVTVHVNAQGFRGPARGPKTRPRALALGDSSVYGFGVEDDEVFTARLEAALPAEFVNGAVPGYSTFQSINLMDMRGWALDPDLLIVGNLWSDNNFDTFVDRDLLASYAGWEASWTRGVRRALEGSALFRWLDWRLRVAPAGERARKVSWELGGKVGRTGDRRVALDDYAANLDALCGAAEARGAGVLFLLLANREDLEAPPPDPAWGPYRRAMRDAAARWGAPLVDVPEVFRASGLSADALLVDRMHPSARGHARIAEAIAAVLEERGWPETPLRLTPPEGPPPERADSFVGKPPPAPQPGRGG